MHQHGNPCRAHVMQAKPFKSVAGPSTGHDKYITDPGLVC